jgi:hypothetical protein
LSNFETISTANFHTAPTFYDTVVLGACPRGKPGGRSVENLGEAWRRRSLDTQESLEESLDTQSAGINRREAENERASQERSSEPS